LRSTAFAFAFALAFASPLAAASAGDVRWEAEEPNRIALDHAGQRNNVDVAYADRGATPAGHLILDGFYDHMGGVVLPNAGAFTGARDSSIDQKGNLRRSSGGEAPDVILPGAGRFFAWYGTWKDADGDGRIRVNPTLPGLPAGNEFALASKSLYGYVEPGHRAPATSTSSGGSDAPDFSYHRGTYIMPLFQSGGITPYDLTVFLDGSLVQAITVESVGDPILSPGDTGKPYTLKETTLVDIDVHAAVAPGPVASLYAVTAGPLVTPAASPNRGFCPQNCRFPPVAPPPVASEPVGVAQGAVFPRYAQETSAGSASTAEGRLADYQEAFRAWADLVPLAVEPHSFLAPEHVSPLLGRTDEGAPAMRSGYFGFHLWTGLWKDLNGDGFVGVASADPYDHGNRPIPDDYVGGFPEFVPVWGVNAQNHTLGPQTLLQLTYRPIPDWGPGVMVTDRLGTPQPAVLGNGESIPPEPLPRLMGAPTVRDPSLWFVTGNATIAMRGLGAPVDTGRYYAFDYLFLPVGTNGFAFEVCHEWLTIAHASGGETRDETVRDCDVIGRLAGT